MPEVTFGIIVLNGEPFTRYCLRALYPFAKDIIVVEGAVEAAACIATPDGHSLDGTLETLHRLKVEEDPEGKVEIVVRDGFWKEKDDMSQAYAERATGDYLWQVDIDEFYQPRDIQAILEVLRDDPEITAVSFKQITFWGGFDYITDGWYLQRGAEICHRLFRWGPGYRYVTHRPTTVIDSHGRNLREINWIGGQELAERGIFMYHYSLVFPKQVVEKCRYYDQASWVDRRRYSNWAERSFMELKDPYRVHNVYEYPSWLERFSGQHPPQIEAMRRDIQEDRLLIEMRPAHDVEEVLQSRRYSFGRSLLKIMWHLERFRVGIAWFGRSILRRLAG